MHKPPAWHGRRGVGPQIHVGIAQQRQDRVVIRRRGELDLPPGRGVAVFGDNRVQQLQLDRPQERFVLFAEVLSLGDEVAHARVVMLVLGIDPGQFLPHLQVTEIVDAEATSGHAPVGFRAPSARPTAPAQ